MRVMLPQKCWDVYWCLGWVKTEYSVTRAEYNCRTGKLIHVYAEKPHRKEIFSEQDLDEHVFFTEQEADSYLSEMEIEDVKDHNESAKTIVL